jgi:hypothetical protein
MAATDARGANLVVSGAAPTAVARKTPARGNAQSAPPAHDKPGASREGRAAAPGKGGGWLQPPQGGASWRQVAYAAARSMRHDLDTMCCRSDPRCTRQVADLIERAEAALKGGRSPWAWFQGTAHERAWLALHEAEWRLLSMMRPEELLSRLPWFLHSARRQLGAQDERVKEAEAILDDARHPYRHPVRLQVTRTPQTHASYRLSARERLAVAHMVRDAYSIGDEQYAASRAFRNRIIMMTATAAAALLLIVLGAHVWHLSLAPGPQALPTGEQTLWDGDPLPEGASAMLAVALFGAVGALLSGIHAVAKSGGSRNPFSLAWWQAWLKLPVGSLSAMVGVFALQSRAFPTIPATRWPELLLWAVGFGAAQQTITRFVDQRVRGLVGEGAPDLSVDESGAAATGADGARNGGSSEDYAIRTSGLRVQAATTHRKEAR